jgi:UDP-N-acetylmuramoyl-tripeptide--D-alanyl-D-alanine ligase
MMALTVGEIAQLCHGVVSDLADPTEYVAGPVVVDSRRVTRGSLFVAVPGARVDGHDFAVQAVADGAPVVLASRTVSVPAVVVGDTVRALGDLARGYLHRLSNPVVVGITGSSGKTSTKDIVGQLLTRLGPTVAPEGSLNTEVGLPLTVLRADAETSYLVLEYSARGLDHIAYLCGIARPRIGVVLNVGTAHLGEFGSRSAVAQAKGELIEAVPDDGLAVLNADDDAVASMAARTSARVVTFGLGAHADVRAVDVALDELARPTFRLLTTMGEVGVSLSLHGAHHVSNALAAAAVAVELGLDLETLAAGLAGIEALSRWRMQVSERADGLVVINDAYNANPESMRAALAALATIGSGGDAERVRGGGPRRTHAVLGVMAELGPAAATAHRELGAEAALIGVHQLVVVGAAASGIADGAIEAGLDPARVSVVDGVADAVSLLEKDLGQGDVVLVKASRSADLQRVADALLAGPVTPAGAHQ